MSDRLGLPTYGGGSGSPFVGREMGWFGSGRDYSEEAAQTIDAEVKRLLDLARTCCKGQDKPIPQATLIFNEETAEGRQMQVYSDLLGKAIRTMIEVKEEKDLDSLFTGGKTTALTNTISGLDDFELITFLVIQEAG